MVDRRYQKQKAKTTKETKSKDIRNENQRLEMDRAWYGMEGKFRYGIWNMHRRAAQVIKVALQAHAQLL